MPEVIGTDIKTGESVKIRIAEKINPESWLNDEEHQWFVKGYRYASTQTMAIDALSKISPEELYYAVASIIRGVGSIDLTKQIEKL